MSGFSKKDDVQQEQAPGPGSSLSAARQAKGLDLQKTAKMLHLTAETVQHLETNSYEQLPARVFIRGYLRNYARLVDLPENEILEVFDQSCPDQECVRDLPKISRGMKGEIRSSHAIVRLVTWVIVLGVIVSIAVSLQDHVLVAWDKLQTLGTGSLVQGEDTASGELLIPVLEEKTSSELPEQAIGSKPGAEQSPEAAQSAREFIIHFTGPVWVDIRDSGESFRLTGDMEAGSSKSLQGEPPFTVMVSDYKQVAITINDASYDIGQHLGNLGADGEVHLQFVVP